MREPFFALPNGISRFLPLETASLLRSTPRQINYEAPCTHCSTKNVNNIRTNKPPTNFGNCAIRVVCTVHTYILQKVISSVRSFKGIRKEGIKFCANLRRTSLRIHRRGADDKMANPDPRGPPKKMSFWHSGRDSSSRSPPPPISSTHFSAAPPPRKLQNSSNPPKMLQKNIVKRRPCDNCH